MTTAPPTASGPAFVEGSSIATSAPIVSLEEASAIAALEYGVTATAHRLIGERDQNFRLQTTTGAQYGLKLIHPAEELAVTNFQTSILLHIERTNPALPIQRVVPTLDGLAEKRIRLQDGTQRMMRMTTFLPGVIVRGLPVNLKRSRNLGRTLAEIQLALADFEHPADDYEILWDIKHASKQRAVVAELDIAERRAVMEAGLARFEARAQRAMPSLRAQVVHNDLSGDNVVADPDDHDVITGVLDFGDATRTAVINDVAVGVAYQIRFGEDLLGAALALLSGFNAMRPLLQEEIDLLLDLVIGRMVVRVGISEWRGRRFPENIEYIRRNTAEAWQALERLLALDPGRTTAAFHDACRTELTP